MKRALRWFGIIVAALVLLVCLGIFGVWLYLQSDGADRQIEAELNHLLSTPDQTITLSGLSGSLPLHWRVAHAELADRNGTWLRADGIVLDLDGTALLRGTGRIETASAQSIAVLRAPTSSATQSSTPPVWTNLDVPHLPIAVELDRLSIPTITIAPSLVGQAINLSVDGDAVLHEAAAHVHFAVLRTDAQKGSVTLNADLQGGAPATLDLKLDAADPGGALLASLAENGETHPLQLTLSGNGPLSNWAGKLQATAAPDSSIASDLTLARHGTDLSVTVKGTAIAGALLPDRMVPAVGASVPFDIGVTLADAGPIGLDHGLLTVHAGTLSASGRYVPSTDYLLAHVVLAADLAPLSALAGETLGGYTTLTADVTGTGAKPIASVALDGSDVTAGDDHLAGVSAHFDVAPMESNGVHVSGNGKLTGLTQAKRTLPAGLGDDVTLVLDATSDLTGDHIALKSAKIEGAGLTLDAAGTRDPGKIVGHAKLVAEDLARFAGLVGTKIAGRVDATADATSRDGSSVAATIQGHFHGFRTGIPAADALIGADASLDAAVSRDVAGTIELSRAKLLAAHLTFDGAGRYPADGRNVAGHGVLVLPDLRPLGPALATKLSGALKLDADLKNNGATVKLTGKFDDGTAHLDAVDATAAIADIHRYAGRISAAIRSGKVSAHLAADVSQPAPNRIDIASLSITGPASDLHGAVQVDLSTKRASGSLQAESRDLAAWSPLLGTSLAGRITASLTLAEAGGQSADATLDGQNLAYGASGIAAQHIKLDAHLTDLFGTPGGTASIDVAAATSSAATIDHAALHAQSAPGGAFAFDLSGTGVAAAKKFTLASTGTLTATQAAQELTLTKFDGSLDTLTLHLGQSLSASKRGAAIALDHLALQLGSGNLNGALRYDGQTVDASLKGTGIAIGPLAALAGRSDIAGTLELDLAVSGSVRSPTGHEVIELAQLQIGSGDPGTIPVLAFSESGDLVPGAVRFKGRVDGTKHQASLGFSGAMPIAFGGSDLVSIPPSGAISGTLEGEGRLETLNELVPIGEDKMSGAYSIALTVGGTVAAPQAGGSLKLVDATYDNSATGMTLRKLNLDVEGNQQAFTLTQFQATDGGDGGISASGRLDLAPAGGPVFNVAATLKSFTAARSDLITAALSGSAKVNGKLTAPAVTGQLTIDRAAVNVPQQLPPNIAVLNVVRIDSRKSAEAQRLERLAAQQAPPSPPFVATLDLKLHDPGQTFVRGDGLDSEWKGDIAVKGTSAQPILIGQLNTINGTFSMLGTDFTISPGTIYFTGSSNPTFDIQAQAQTADVTATITVQGTPEKPTLTLGSTPALPQDEILSRVMFGSGMSQLSPAQGLELAQAVATLSSGGGPGILDRLRNFTGLDRLSIGQDATAGQQGGGGVASGTTLSGGKYVSPGVYVGVAQGLGGSTQAQVKVNVTSHVTVNAVAGAGGSSTSAGSSLGVQYQLDY
jgi:translocation and assembly module TamB